MATDLLQIVTRLANVNGFPADSAQNVLNFGFNAAPSGTDIDAIFDEIVDFWNVVQAGATNSVGEYISDAIDRTANACELLAYVTDDLTGATPFGSPVDQRSFTLVAAGDITQMPHEIAMVISYNGDLSGVPISQANPSPPPATIRPASRRKGRMYIGPLISGLVVDTTDGNARPTTAFRFDLAKQFQILAQNVDALTAGFLGVWSKLDAEVYSAVSCHTDDAWDSQRRRGPDAINRTTLAI